MKKKNIKLEKNIVWPIKRNYLLRHLVFKGNEEAFKIITEQKDKRS